MSLPGSKTVFAKPCEIGIIIEVGLYAEMFLYSWRKWKIMPFRVVWRGKQVAGVGVKRTRRTNSDGANRLILGPGIFNHLYQAVQSTGL